MKKIVIISLVALLIPQVALCWGRLGHRTIAEIAERNLTPKAKANIEWKYALVNLYKTIRWVSVIYPQMKFCRKSCNSIYSVLHIVSFNILIFYSRILQLQGIRYESLHNYVYIKIGIIYKFDFSDWNPLEFRLHL